MLLRTNSMPNAPLTLLNICQTCGYVCLQTDMYSYMYTVWLSDEKDMTLWNYGKTKEHV